MKTYLGWIVAALIVTFALAGDPTCPSDLNSDGTVATADLLQLLSAWGPCPSPPTVIAGAAFTGGSNPVARRWSDGSMQYRSYAGDWKSEWFDVPGPNEPPDIDVRLVSVAIEFCCSNDLVVFRFWSDGTVEANRKNCGDPANEWCGWETATR